MFDLSTAATKLALVTTDAALPLPCGQRNIDWPAMLCPLGIKLVLQDLSSSFPSQAGLFKLEFTHLHVITPSYEQNGRPAWVQLHLPSNVLTIKVSKPEATAASVFTERDAEVTLTILLA